jgi:hypothetical protein
MNLSVRIKQEIEKKEIKFDSLRDRLLQHQKNTVTPLYHTPFSSYKAYIVLKEDDKLLLCATINSLFSFPIGQIVVFKKEKISKGFEVTVEIQESKFYLVVVGFLNLIVIFLSVIKFTGFLNVFIILVFSNGLLFFQYLFFRFKSKCLIKQKLAEININI